MTKRRFIDAPGSVRCAQTIVLADASKAQCGRARKYGDLCSQHHKMTARRRQPGPSECGPRKDFRPKKGFWHCCHCHRGFTLKPGVLACPYCQSGDIFDTMDKEGWRLADEENARPKVQPYE